LYALNKASGTLRANVVVGKALNLVVIEVPVPVTVASLNAVPLIEPTVEPDGRVKRAALGNENVAQLIFKGIGLFFLEMPEFMSQAIERYLRAAESKLWSNKNVA
jgi:hypothetical protein